jgi:hypothetical protein
MDLLHHWTFLGFAQKAAFLFLFVVAILTAIRGGRLARSSLRAADEAHACRRRRARRWARSTRGLATAAVWFTCSAAAIGLVNAYNVLVSSSRPILAYIIDDSLRVLDASGVALGLCALLLATAALFEFVGDRADDGRMAAVTFIRRSLGWLGAALVGAALLGFRPTFVAELGQRGDAWIGHAGFQALGLLWLRLAPLAGLLGLTTWVVVLVESAVRRARDVRPTGPGHGPPGTNVTRGGWA